MEALAWIALLVFAAWVAFGVVRQRRAEARSYEEWRKRQERNGWQDVKDAFDRMEEN